MDSERIKMETEDIVRNLGRAGKRPKDSAVLYQADRNTELVNRQFTQLVREQRFDGQEYHFAPKLRLFLNSFSDVGILVIGGIKSATNSVEPKYEFLYYDDPSNAMAGPIINEEVTPRFLDWLWINDKTIVKYLVGLSPEQIQKRFK